jgi:hypothetical protein
MNEFDEEELAEIIDEWYFSWKDTITDDGLPHNFRVRQGGPEKPLGSGSTERIAR